VADGASGQAGAQATLDAALADARRHLPAGLDCRGEARQGKAHEQVVAAVRATGADLVVMGRHADSLGGRAFLGGTAQKVIGTAELPVLVVIAEESRA
jgi:nucleotide-binding universal stress UspA family protein